MVPYPCYYPQCSKTFSTRFNLRRHVNVSHLEIRAFICEVCKKTFASKQNLREHGFIHTGEKPFTCPFPGCDRRYRQASQLAFHKRGHYKRESKVFHPPSFHCLGLLPLLALQLDYDDSLAYQPPISHGKPVVLPGFEGGRRLQQWKLPIVPALLT